MAVGPSVCEGLKIESNAAERPASRPRAGNSPELGEQSAAERTVRSVGGAWPFLVGGLPCQVDSGNERDLSLLNSHVRLLPDGSAS